MHDPASAKRGSGDDPAGIEPGAHEGAAHVRQICGVLDVASLASLRSAPGSGRRLRALLERAIQGLETLPRPPVEASPRERNQHS